jgi:hypothetical protein
MWQTLCMKRNSNLCFVLLPVIIQNKNLDLLLLKSSISHRTSTSVLIWRALVFVVVVVVLVLSAQFTPEPQR